MSRTIMDRNLLSTRHISPMGNRRSHVVSSSSSSSSRIRHGPDGDHAGARRVPSKTRSNTMLLTRSQSDLDLFRHHRTQNHNKPHPRKHEPSSRSKQKSTKNHHHYNNKVRRQEDDCKDQERPRRPRSHSFTTPTSRTTPPSSSSPMDISPRTVIRDNKRTILLTQRRSQSDVDLFRTQNKIQHHQHHSESNTFDDLTPKQGNTRRGLLYQHYLQNHQQNEQLELEGIGTVPRQQRMTQSTAVSLLHQVQKSRSARCLTPPSPLLVQRTDLRHLKRQQSMPRRIQQADAIMRGEYAHSHSG